MMLSTMPTKSNVVLQKIDRQKGRCSRMGSEDGKKGKRDRRT